jgi:hypothetical protein
VTTKDVLKDALQDALSEVEDPLRVKYFIAILQIMEKKALEPNGVNKISVYFTLIGSEPFADEYHDVMCLLIARAWNVAVYQNAGQELFNGLLGVMSPAGCNIRRDLEGNIVMSGGTTRRALSDDIYVADLQLLSHSNTAVVRHVAISTVPIAALLSGIFWG